MFEAIIAILVGLIILVWSADRFVIGAAAIAQHMGMSSLLVGLTVVSLGTSAPEMFVSATAALDGVSELAIGNALGSNITNIGLVLGITALIAPLPIKSGLLRKELPILFIVTVVGGLVLADFHLSMLDGVFLLITLVVALYLLLIVGVKEGESMVDEEEAELINATSGKMAAFWLFIGLVLLIVSSKMLVWGATGVAHYYGLSDLVIGLTILAIGTSLPELAASVSSALKGHHDIAIGNVVGSNIFNLLAVLPIPALIAPVAIEEVVLYRDYGVMLGMTALLLGFIYLLRKKMQVGRVAGFCLLAAYISYMGLLYVMAS
jgi:cation:H+ antiporter